MARGFEYGLDVVATPPCEPDAAPLVPFTEAEHAPAVCWVQLVVLKGRLAHLERWVRDGGTGDRDATWGRLIRNELPEQLADTSGRRRTYHRLRAWLAGALPEVLHQLAPTLEQLGQLPLSRTLRTRFLAVVERGWDRALPLPRSGFPTMVAHARDASGELAERGMG